MGAAEFSALVSVPMSGQPRPLRGTTAVGGISRRCRRSDPAATLGVEPGSKRQILPLVARPELHIDMRQAEIVERFAGRFEPETSVEGRRDRFARLAPPSVPDNARSKIAE